MIPVDASLAYALLDGGDQRHAAAAAWYQHARPELVTTPLVVAEMDHLAMTRAGRDAATAWRADLTAGAYAIEWWDAALDEAAAVAEQYRDLGLGLTDASLVALAARMGTTSVATFDERHFRAVRPVTGGSAFRLLPLDAV